MIADLKPYAERKESGLPWLGQVPGHWDVSPLAGLARLKSIVNQPERQLLSIYLQRGVVRFTDVDEKRTNATSEDLSKYQAVDPGDFVLNNQQAWRGSVGVSDYSGIVSPAYLVLALSNRYSAPYANMLFRDQCMVSQYLVCSKGVGTIQRNLYWPHLKRVGVVVPPLDEQSAIVRFLEWANARLERAIRAKRKVIALLNEQKQAIIHRAVTRGLPSTGSGQAPPSVPLKPSSVPWLGDIPKHWEVRPLKAVCKIQSGITLGKDYVGQTTHEYPYLRVANVQAGHVNLAVVKTIRVTKSEALRCTLQAGDVLMTEGGDPDKLGRGCVWEVQITPCLHQNHVFAVRPNQLNLEPHFLSALMGTRYARAYFESTAKQTTNLASTNKTKIGQFAVLLPNVGEQQRILSALSEETRPLDIAISRLEREIELLREYRTRLVADVVTGKLDVRAAVAKLPEEPDEPEPLDDADPLTDGDEEMGDADLGAVTKEAEA
jgi:type I restriction enzyme, S subunit